MDRAFFDAAALRIKQSFTSEIDANLPVWARRTNPIVRRDLGSYWKTLTPDMMLVLRVYLVQIALIAVSFVIPVLFVLLMPTVTVTLVLLPVGIILYGQILYHIGAAAATSVVRERSHDTLDLLLIIPHSTQHTLFSKVAAAIWRETENLSLIIMGTALASLPLMIIQYDIFLSLTDHPVLMRFSLALGLGMAILRVLIEPIMIGALGTLIGAALPARVPAVVTTTILGAAYFLLINLPRLAPLDVTGRLVIEIVLPVVLPLILTYGAFRAAAMLLVRD